MITITDRAADKAKEVLAAEGKENWGLRIYSAGGGCCGPSYGLDIDEIASTDDEVIEKNGLRVFVDKAMMPTLSGMKLDYMSGPEGECFVLTKEGSSCGSGCTSCG